MPTHEDLAERAARVLGTDHPDAGSLQGDLAEATRRSGAGDKEAAALAVDLRRVDTERWAGRAADIPGWDLAEGMVGWVNGQRCVVIGPDDRPEERRNGPWQVMPCSGEWEDCPTICSDMPRSTRLDEFTLDPDAAASAGCLMVMLGPGAMVRHDEFRGNRPAFTACAREPGRGDSTTPGRACIVLAEFYGRWPGTTP